MEDRKRKRGTSNGCTQLRRETLGDIEGYLKSHEHKDLLRLTTCRKR